jgi:hypothetical protein
MSGTSDEFKGDQVAGKLKGYIDKLRAMLNRRR